MNSKGGGRKALNTWVIVSEVFLYGTAFVAFRGLGWYSFLVCSVLFMVQAMAILQNKRNVLAKINRMRKPKIGLIACLGIIIIMKDIMNGAYWLMAFGFLLSYGLCSAYAANLYRWVIRWEDMMDEQESQFSHRVTLTNMDFDVMTHKNGIWLLTRLFPSFLAGGTVFALLWISPLVQWPINAVKYVFLKVTLMIAALLLGIIPDQMYKAVELETSGDAVTPDPNAKFLQEAERLSRSVDFQAGYVIAGIILTVLLIAVLTFYVYKASKKKGVQTAALKATEMGNFEKIQKPFALEKKSIEGKNRHVHESDVLLRKKYRQLLKKLSQKGYPITETETPDQIRTKLLILYPNQDEWIQVITDAYCERRYADREPKNMDEVLRAFSLLKEDNHDRS